MLDDLPVGLVDVVRNVLREVINLVVLGDVVVVVVVVCRLNVVVKYIYDSVVIVVVVLNINVSVTLIVMFSSSI